MKSEDAISRQAAIEGLASIAKAKAKSDAQKSLMGRVMFFTEQLSSVSTEKTERWIPVSERLPEDFGAYLITLENGDVCNCEFNPDFIDEEHENGAFTYYHQYFDPATLGMIDEEEEAVDAIAWMPFEPYEPQESEGKI